MGGYTLPFKIEANDPAPIRNIAEAVRLAGERAKASAVDIQILEKGLASGVAAGKSFGAALAGVEKSVPHAGIKAMAEELRKLTDVTEKQTRVTLRQVEANNKLEESARRAAAESREASRMAQLRAFDPTGGASRLTGLEAGIAGRIGGSLAGSAVGLPGLGFAGAGIARFLGPAGIAAGAGIGAAVLGVRAFENAEKTARDVAKLAESLGIASTRAYDLSASVSIAGGKMSDLESASQHLSRSLEDPAGAGRKTIDALLQLGVSAVDVSGKLRPTGDVIEDVIEKINRLPDGVQKSALGFQALGSSIRDLSGVHEIVHGISPSQEDLDRIALATDYWKKLWEEIKSGSLSFVAGSLRTKDQVVSATRPSNIIERLFSPFFPNMNGEIPGVGSNPGASPAGSGPSVSAQIDAFKATLVDPLENRDRLSKASANYRNKIAAIDLLKTRAGSGQAIGAGVLENAETEARAAQAEYAKALAATKAIPSGGSERSYALDYARMQKGLDQFQQRSLNDQEAQGERAMAIEGDISSTMGQRLRRGDFTIPGSLAFSMPGPPSASFGAQLQMLRSGGNALVRSAQSNGSSPSDILALQVAIADKEKRLQEEQAQGITNEEQRRSRMEDISEQHELTLFELKLSHEEKIQQLRQKQEESFKNAVGSGFSALVQGPQAFQSFLKGQGMSIAQHVAENGAGLLFPHVQNALRIPGLNGDSTIGKLLAGTPFGVNGADPHIKATDANTDALNRLNATLGGAPSLSSGIPGSYGGASSSIINRIGGLFGGASSGNPMVFSGFGGGSGGGLMGLGGSGGGGFKGFGDSPLAALITGQAQGDGYGYNLSSSQRIGSGVAVAGALYGGYQGVRQISKGGAGNVLSGVGSVAMAAGALDPEPISKAALMIGGAVSSLIGSFLGNSPQKREAQIQRRLASNVYYQPVSVNQSMDGSGFFSDLDSSGNARGSNLSPLPTVEEPYYDYRHSTMVPGRALSPFGGGLSSSQATVNVNINAIDRKSVADLFLDHTEELGNGLMKMSREWHPALPHLRGETL